MTLQSHCLEMTGLKMRTRSVTACSQLPSWKQLWSNDMMRKAVNNHSAIVCGQVGLYDKSDYITSYWSWVIVKKKFRLTPSVFIGWHPLFGWPAFWSTFKPNYLSVGLSCRPAPPGFNPFIDFGPVRDQFLTSYRSHRFLYCRLINTRWISQSIKKNEPPFYTVFSLLANACV